MPCGDLAFAKCEGGPHLTADSQQNEVGFRVMVGLRADDDGGALFVSRLIGKRKRDQDNGAEVITGRIRHRPGYSRSGPARVLTLPVPLG